MDNLNFQICDKSRFERKLIMELKDATIEDCGFIASIFDNDEFEKYFAENDTTEQEWKERFESLEGIENKIIYVHKEPIGWFTYQVKESICEIGIIVVKYDRIGCGVGYEAFHSVISSLSQNIKTVKLDVQQQNHHAVAFYKRYGFKVVGEERQPVGDHEELYYNMELQR